MDVARNVEGLAQKTLAIGLVGLAFGGAGLGFDRDSEWEILHLIPVPGVVIYVLVFVAGVVILVQRVRMLARTDTDCLRLVDRGVLLPRKGGLVPWQRISGVRVRRLYFSVNLDLLTEDGTKTVGELYLGRDADELAAFIDRLRTAPDRASLLAAAPASVRG